MQLAEVGKDFPIRIRTWTKDPKYKRVKALTLRSRHISIRVAKLREAVSDLQKRYPKLGYYLKREKVSFETYYETGERIFWIVGRSQEDDKDVPLYYSTTLRRLFVPRSLVERQYRLVCTVLMYRLRSLGVRYRLRYA
jgi:hypothetical protein